MLFDSHAHLNDEALINRTEEIVDNAKNNGVTKMVCVGYDRDSSLMAVNFASRYPGVYAAIGVHPQEAKGEPISLDWLLELGRHPKVVAIGEIGLDHYWDKTHSEQQKEIFIRQIEIAQELKLPIVVHMREATKETHQVLKDHLPNGAKGVMHCYSASKEALQQFLDLGMYISLAGPVTFKNAKVPKEVAVAVPEDRLLIETDSPYLAPMPFRGKQNEPSYVRYVAEEIAKLRSVTFEELATLTYGNACKLFNIENNEVK